MLPFFQSETWPRANNDLPVIGTSSQVTLSTPKRFLNMFSITPTNASASPTATPVVMLHGFGAGMHTTSLYCVHSALLCIVYVKLNKIINVTH